MLDRLVIQLDNSVSVFLPHTVPVSINTNGGLQLKKLTFSVPQKKKKKKKKKQQHV